MLGLDSCASKDFQRAYASKLKNALSGRAWDMTHKDKHISATKLKELSSLEDDVPFKVTNEVINVVRHRCEKVAPISEERSLRYVF